MLFIGVAIVIAVGIALLISADAGSLVGLTQDQTAALVPMLVLLIVFAGGAFARRHRFGELVGNLALWIGIFGVVLVGYTYRDDLSGVASRVVGEILPGQAIVEGERGTATFRRGRGGHFQVNAAINGETIPLIFDTGATAVVLTDADARRVGIDTARLDYNVSVSTANGTGRAAAVLLDTMDVGGIVRSRVRAFIAEPGALEVSLLGMTFLETLQRYTVTSNSLELIG